MEHASGSRVESDRESSAQRLSRGTTVHNLAPGGSLRLLGRPWATTPPWPIRVSSPCPVEATFVQEN